MHISNRYLFSLSNPDYNKLSDICSNIRELNLVVYIDIKYMLHPFEIYPLVKQLSKTTKQIISDSDLSFFIMPRK